MYPNIRAELARQRITQAELAEKLKKNNHPLSLSQLSMKLNGKYDFTFPEAVAIRDILCPEMPLEEMFAV